MTIVFEKTDAIDVLIDGAQTSAPEQPGIFLLSGNFNYNSGFNNVGSVIKVDGPDNYLQIYGYNQNDYIMLNSVSYETENSGQFRNIYIDDEITVIIHASFSLDTYINTIEVDSLPVGISMGTNLNYSPINQYFDSVPVWDSGTGQSTSIGTVNFMSRIGSEISQSFAGIYTGPLPEAEILNFKCFDIVFNKDTNNITVFNSVDLNDFIGVYQSVGFSTPKYIDNKYRVLGYSKINYNTFGPFYIFNYQRQIYVDGVNGSFVSDYEECQLEEIDTLISDGYLIGNFCCDDNNRTGIYLFKLDMETFQYIFHKTIYIIDIENFTYQSITMIGGLNPDGGFIFDNWGDIQLFPTIFADKTGKINIYAGATYPYYYGSLVFPQITTSYRSRLPVKLECSNYCIPLLKKGAK